MTRKYFVKEGNGVTSEYSSKAAYKRIKKRAKVFGAMHARNWKALRKTVMLRRGGRRSMRHIMAYSDPAAGYNGGIYRAANFIYLGTTKSEQHVQDADGRIMHRRGVYHYRRRCGVETAAEVRDMLGLSLIMTPPKDRWFIDLSGEWPGPWLRPVLRSANVVKTRKTTGVT